jgi:DNA-binding transcriptional ArsR family regulator
MHDEDERLALAAMFRPLGDPNRLGLLLACLDGEQPVGALAARLGLSQPLASHHLRVLRDAHLLRARKLGKLTLYSVADEHVSHMLRDMLAHVRHAPSAGQIPDAD